MARDVTPLAAGRLTAAGEHREDARRSAPCRYGTRGPGVTQTLVPLRPFLVDERASSIAVTIPLEKPLGFGHLTRKAAAIGFGRMAVVASQFLLNMLLVRWWRPELFGDLFGQFQEVRVAIGLAALLDLGLPLGLLQATAGMADRRRDEVFLHGISLALLCGLAAGVLMAPYGLLASDTIPFAWPAAGLLIAATIPSAALESVLTVRNLHVRSSVISGAAGLIGLALSAGALLVHPTAETVYLCLAVPAIIRLVALWRLSGLGLPTIPTVRDIGPLVAMSLRVSGVRLLGMLSMQVDRVVVTAFFSAATLGHYVTGAWEVPFMTVFLGAILAAILPDMSEHWAAERREDMLAIWKGAVSRAAWLVFPVWLWAWIWAPELIAALFTPEYADSVPVFRAYLLVLPLRVASWAAPLIAMDRTRVLLWGAAADVAVNVAASLVLAGAFGWWIGPAVATALGTYVQILVYLTFIRKYVGVSPLPSPAVEGAVQRGHGGLAGGPADTGAAGAGAGRSVGPRARERPSSPW